VNSEKDYSANTEEMNPDGDQSQIMTPEKMDSSKIIEKDSTESVGSGVPIDSTLKEKKDFNKGMAQSVSLESCPYCGGVFEKSKNQSGYEKHKCKNCGYEFYLENEKAVEKLFALNSFRNEVINLLHAKVDGGKDDRILSWKKREKEFEKYIEQCGGESNQDPLFAITRAAYLTDGFERYFPKEEKITVEALYTIAKQYVSKNKKATNIKELIQIYHKKLRHKSRKWLVGLGSGFVALFLAVFIVLFSYTPTVTDDVFGISVQIPNNAVSVFEKFSINVNMEEHPVDSAVYIDAKNALRNETEKFKLYDISLKKGDASVEFDGEVTVEIPIPQEYQSSALKVYHVSTDEVYEEIPSIVSVANNTVSFKTSHFSLFAIAERHPIVSFDSGSILGRLIVNPAN